MAKKKKSKNKSLDVSTPFQVCGELIKQDICLFDGEPVKVSTIEIDAKNVSSKRGLLAPITAGVIGAEKVTYACGNKRFTAKKGDVVVLQGTAATAFFGGFTRKELDIIGSYEAAKAYYIFSASFAGACHTNLDIEAKAVEYLATTCSNEGYWRSTVFNALKKHDQKILKNSKKYYSKYLKGQNNGDNAVNNVSYSEAEFQDKSA